MGEQKRWECEAFGEYCMLETPTQCGENGCAFLKSLNLFQVGVSLYRKSPCEPLFVNVAGEKITDRWTHDVLEGIAKELDGRITNHGNFPMTASIKIENRVFGYTVYPLFRDFLMILFRDVTESENKRTIEKYRNVFEQYNRIISEIIHEIGNPLAGIMGVLQVTLLNLDSYDKEEVAGKIDSALLEVKRLSKILKLLRPLGADSQALWERINIKETLEYVLEENLKEHKTISYRFEKIPEHWYETLRKVDFIKVVDEIIDNAVSAMPDGGEIVIRPGQETMHHSEIVVQDSGLGISEDMLERVFNPFFSGFTDRKGMGLTIARKRMLNMGGMLFAKPCLSGACFVILIPSGGAYELFGPIG